MVDKNAPAATLTKRELAAMFALKGLLAAESHDWHLNDDEVIARKAVMLADFLFDELEGNNG